MKSKEIEENSKKNKGEDSAKYESWHVCAFFQVFLVVKESLRTCKAIVKRWKEKQEVLQEK